MTLICITRRQYFKGRVSKSNKVEWYFLLFFAGHNHSKVCRLIRTAYILMYITHRVYILFDFISFYAVLCYSCPMTIWYIGWHDTLYFDVRPLPCKNITSLRNCCDFLYTKPEIKNRIALRREKSIFKLTSLVNMLYIWDPSLVIAVLADVRIYMGAGPKQAQTSLQW